MKRYKDDVRISLAAIRVNANKTQEEWAQSIGVSRSCVSKWETGKSFPDLSSLRIISRISGIGIDYIC